MDDKKKKFVLPEADVVDFSNEDIITASILDANNANWLEDPDGETFVA